MSASAKQGGHNNELGQRSSS